MMGKAPLPKSYDQKEVIIVMGRIKKENFMCQRILWIIFCLFSEYFSLEKYKTPS